MNTDPNTEEKILQAARDVFTSKGFAATRMQEIADHAGINKGLLHYYFKSKERLFRAVFSDAFRRFMRSINPVIDSNAPLLEKIRTIVHSYLEMLLENPLLPGFLANEIHTNHEGFLQEMFQDQERPHVAELIVSIQLEVQAGRIREDVNPFHLVMNILSMCAFPFIARPMLTQLTPLNDETFMILMHQREQEIMKVIERTISKNP
ncbi:MAG: TetR/AcrR family transcriptional regulator [Lewinellaceae bacterium]|nr:TetR/AcrR family transcriptional regulator [Lewinellaceae bacterium]